MEQIAQKSIGVDGKVFLERRAVLRRRSLKPAILSFNRGFSTFECIVRNVSENGAMLSFGETFALPDTVTLWLDGMAHQIAQVRWRGSSAVGVEFVAG
jgi:hypothetical protein